MRRLALALLLAVQSGGGCATPRSRAPRTLEQTQIQVLVPITRFQNAAVFGEVSPGQLRRVNGAYAAYEEAFAEALQASGGDLNASTPARVGVLANEVVCAVCSIPHLPY